MRGPNRRDFLKLATAFAGGLAAPRWGRRGLLAPPDQASSSPNILIIVFDAMSATNLSLYGYPRQTTPNLERFAARATVYHDHYSAGTFTTPGTASLMTGMYPWTHRAYDEGALIERDLVTRNIFHAVGDRYERLGFSQNSWPNYFLGQFHADIEKVIEPAEFGLVFPLWGAKFRNDLVGGYRAFDDFLLQDSMPPGSLLLGLAARLYGLGTRPPAEQDLSGLTLKHVFDGMLETVRRLRAPWLAYMHLMPPHSPYEPSRDFVGRFADGWLPPLKRTHKLVDPHRHHSTQVLNELRQTYDEYIANADAELGRFLDLLRAEGFLDTSYVIVTSDHGESFERGEWGHATPLMYEPLVRIPLIVSGPGQTQRRDIETTTSGVDILPTLTHLVGQEVPAWAEGRVLPALGGTEDAERSVFMMDAKLNSAFKPISVGSFGMRKGDYKLIYYKGYKEIAGKNRFELYNLSSDPEEINDINSSSSAVANELRGELLDKLGPYITS